MHGSLYFKCTKLNFRNYVFFLFAVPHIGESIISSPSSQSMHQNSSACEIQSSTGTAGGGPAEHKGNTHFMRKIPHGAEASNILVGKVDFLEKNVSVFIRLNEATIMGDLTEVPVPTRY